MKVSDYNKFKEFFEANPDATEAPDSVIEDNKPIEGQITLDEVLKQINEVNSKVEKLAELTDKLNSLDNKDDTSAIDELKAEVKSLKEDTQHAAQAEADMPQEQTADDIIRKFIEGGK
ncbi:MAG: hypothetical protein IIZ78_11880 [Clostridiales bacterium]|nr:hypothetical protein [Clostridiales bacterium]